MSPFTRPIVWIASLTLLATVSQAAVTETKDQHYQVIITRNAFGLKPVPIVEPTKPEEGPPPNIKLTALIGITEPKKAMFVVTPAGKGVPLYLTVNEGDVYPIRSERCNSFGSELASGAAGRALAACPEQATVGPNQWVPPGTLGFGARAHRKTAGAAVLSAPFPWHWAVRVACAKGWESAKTVKVRNEPKSENMDHTANELVIE